MSFEMRENKNGIIIFQVRTHGDCVKVEAFLDGKINVAFFVEDVDGAKSPTVGFKNFSVTFGSRACAAVESICFYDCRVRDLRLESRLRFDARKES